MNKICTSLEQSKKLKELGIDINTADMYYYTVNGDWEWYETPNIMESIDDLNEHTIPAWSLTALLDVLPKNYGRYTKSLYWFDDSWHCEYIDQDGEGHGGETADNPVDACYKMILKLNKVNLL